MPFQVSREYIVFGYNSFVTVKANNNAFVPIRRVYAPLGTRQSYGAFQILEKIMKFTISLLVALAAAIVTGCTIMDGGAIVTGNTRAPISSAEVRLYRSAPGNFEEIAIVSASAGHDFKKSSSLMNSAIERLKEEAAKVGANGVILTEIDERDAPSVITSHGTATATGTGGSAYATGNATSISRGDAYTRIRGVAIYVSQ
jgi:hypothetical protein